MEEQMDRKPYFLFKLIMYTLHIYQRGLNKYGIMLH